MGKCQYCGDYANGATCKTHRRVEMGAFNEAKALSDAQKIKFRLDFEIAIREESIKRLAEKSDIDEGLKHLVGREFRNELAILKKIRGDEDEV